MNFKWVLNFGRYFFHFKCILNLAGGPPDFTSTEIFCLGLSLICPFNLSVFIGHIQSNGFFRPHIVVRKRATFLYRVGTEGSEVPKGPRNPRSQRGQKRLFPNGIWGRMKLFARQSLFHSPFLLTLDRKEALFVHCFIFSYNFYS